MTAFSQCMRENTIPYTSCFIKLEQFHSKNFEKKIVFDFHEIEMCTSYPCKKLVYKISELKLVINVQF